MDSVEAVFPQPVIAIPGLNITINESVVSTWIMMAIVIGIVLILRKKMPFVLEMLIDFTADLAGNFIKGPTEPYVPFLGTLLVFIATANLLGKVFWRSPAGFPWAIAAAADAAPDFAAHETDPARGAPPPEDFQLHPRRVHFGGYRRDGATIEWRYTLDLDDASPATFTERVAAWRDADRPTLLGLRRVLHVTAPAGQTAWLRVATSDRPPQAIGDGSQARHGTTPSGVPS